MFETTDELMTQIRLGEDSSLALKNLEYKGNQVFGSHRKGMADELAAMANTANGVFIIVHNKHEQIKFSPTKQQDHTALRHDS